MNLPPLGPLRTFETTARLLSVKQAARDLAVTPAAVRLGLRTLEAHLGLQLFQRRGNTLALTEAGAAYHAHVREAFRYLAERTERLVGAARTLRLSVAPSVASRWLMPRLPTCVARCPGVVISLNTSLRLVDFSRESVDAAIRSGRDAWPNLDSRALTARTLVAVASPALVGQNARVDKDAEGWPFIEVSTLPGEWDEGCRRAGIERQEARKLWKP